ncbi:MAG: HEAT repeat domain-containing protein [Chlamydiia bacterium]|nr:HEAT repeat domain-containing protein [Chlamydiia bacterium]
MGLPLILLTLLVGMDDTQIRYLAKRGEVDQAINLYCERSEEKPTLLQDLCLNLLEKNFATSDHELQALSLIGASLAINEKTFPLFERALNARHLPNQMLASRALLSSLNDDADTVLINHLRHLHPFIRLEVMAELAMKKHPLAYSLVEATQPKLPRELLVHFPGLLATIGTEEALLQLKKLLHHPSHAVREQAIVQIATHQLEEFLPTLRTFATHPDQSQQVAALFALTHFSDRLSLPIYEKGREAPHPEIQTISLFGLAKMGDEAAKQSLFTKASDCDLLAIPLLSAFPDAKTILESLLNHPNATVKLNATLALIDLGHPINTDFFFIPLHKHPSNTHVLWYWEPLATTDPLTLEEDLFHKEEILEKCRYLPEETFLTLAKTLFDKQQNGLIPPLVSLLASTETPAALALLETNAEKPGAPLIRSWCHLALARRDPSSHHLAASLNWLETNWDTPFVNITLPAKKRKNGPITHEERIRLTLAHLDTLSSLQETQTHTLLLKGLRTAHPHWRPLIAGLLMRCQA